tara:strand:+ start:627 stop:863 length:237 start_codon:yes stop_codon:yes gene_type:complete
MKIYLAEIPEICGYGIQILSECPKKAERLLKKEYYAWRKTSQFEFHSRIDTYAKAVEYFGGGVSEIKLNQTYHDGFKN